jgi:DNA repair exonuclease SbcCD ATPase subunit
MKIPAMSKSLHMALISVAVLTVFGNGKLAHARSEEMSDIGIEAETTTVEVEAVQTEGDKTRQIAQDEKDRAAREREIAAREAASAKVALEHAQAELAVYTEEMKRNRAERIAAEKKTAIARAELEKTQSEEKAREIELSTVREMNNNTVAERDRVELSVQQTQEHVDQLGAQIKTEKQRKIDEDKRLADAQEHLKQKQAEAAANQRQLEIAQATALEAQKKADIASRGPESVNPVTAGAVKPGAGERTEGWIKLRRPCSLQAAASQDAAKSTDLPVGQRVYARKLDSSWLLVKDANGATSGYLPVMCVR